MPTVPRHSRDAINRAATTVLPEPTSPWSKRFIGLPVAISCASHPATAVERRSAHRAAPPARTPDIPRVPESRGRAASAIGASAAVIPTADTVLLRRPAAVEPPEDGQSCQENGSPIGPAQRQQIIRLTQRLWQGIDQTISPGRKRLPQRLPQPALRQPFGQWVNRHDPRRLKVTASYQFPLWEFIVSRPRYSSILPLTTSCIPGLMRSSR